MYKNGVCRNNAGVMFCPYQLSEDGIELQFATNHICNCPFSMSIYKVKKLFFFGTHKLLVLYF